MAVAEHLVGRAEALRSLDDLLAAVDGGDPAAVEVVGEPGIGKTRLLADVAERADADGRLVLSGAASELERDLPFGVFVDALDEYLQGLEPRRLDALDDQVRNGLANVFPSLSELATAEGAAFRHERHRSHRAVRELLERLTAISPLVLVLDDLHWADPASIDLLGALLRRRPDAPALLVLALRPQQAPALLSRALEPARRTGTLARIELDPLTRVEAAELLGESVDEATATALYDESGGNPFYLEQLARVVERTSAVAVEPQGSLGDLQVPPLVVAALAEELALIPDEARALLLGAAVAGDPFDPELASAAAAFDEASPLEAVDELLRLDVSRETDAAFAFGIRSYAARSTSRPPAGGGSARTSVVPPPSGLEVWARRNGHTTSSGPGGKGTRRPSRRCARPEARRLIVLRPAPPIGSRLRSACSATTPAPTSASSSCLPAREHWPRAGTSTRRIPRCSNP
jgi:predicted ATPase